MSNMLTQEDLKAIGQIVEEKVENGIKTQVPPLIKVAVDEIVGGIGEIIDEDILPRFDKIEKHLVSLESGMITKHDLDDKLSHYVQKPRLASV